MNTYLRFWKGERWSKPRTLLSQDAYGGLPKVIANKVTVLSNGSWALPFWTEFPRKAVQPPVLSVIESTRTASVPGII